MYVLRITKPKSPSNKHSLVSSGLSADFLDSLRHGSLVLLALVDEILSSGDVVGAAEEGVDLLERHLLGLGNEEVHEHREKHVDAREEIERVESVVLEKQREELLEDRVGDVLRLRRHAHCLGTYVHRENLGRPDPDCGTP